MKIKSVSIKNFKTFDDHGITMSMSDMTTLIGENSIGKSNVLEALDLFFNYSKSKINFWCFHHNNIKKVIETRVEFCKLSDQEKRIFKIHIDPAVESLTITQKISLSLPDGVNAKDIDPDAYEFEESKHGTKYVTADGFEWANWIDSDPTKTNLKKWWKNDLKIGDIDFKSMFVEEGEPDPALYKEAILRLWDEHFDAIPKIQVTGDEKMLGWKNKLKSNLPKFFYVPAVKSINEDLKVLKNNPFGEMVSWLTKNISSEIKSEFEKKALALVQESLAKIDRDENGESKIAFINDQINKNLGDCLDCKLEIKFGDPQLNDIVFPTPRLFADDGYISDIVQKGHGVQRLCILSLLRTYNDFKRKSCSEMSSVILAIEEPEIYLHPPVKRYTYKMLRELSLEEDQILYTTHDDYFVSVEHFDEIRLFRKIIKHGEKPRSDVYEFSLETLIEDSKHRYGKDIQPDSLRHRFGHICDESKNEGFFANKVILVEGDSEKYALPMYFDQRGLSLDSERICIITAESVDCINYLYIMFNEFHILSYVIFDGDKPSVDLNALSGKAKDNAKKKSKRNRDLFTFLGQHLNNDTEYFFPPTQINESFSVWEKDFEEAFHIPLKQYDDLKEAARATYGTDSKPLTARYIASEICANYPEEIPKIIDELVSKIKTCKWSGTCLMQKAKDDI